MCGNGSGGGRVLGFVSGLGCAHYVLSMSIDAVRSVEFLKVVFRVAVLFLL